LGDIKGTNIWASDEFIKQLGRLLDEKGNVKEVPRLQRYVGKTPADLKSLKGEKGREKPRIKIFMGLMSVMVIR